MAEVILSNRMQALTDMVTPGTVITDVGCDHGFVSVYLVQKGISPRVIAMDVRSGPLEHYTYFCSNNFFQSSGKPIVFTSTFSYLSISNSI